MRTKVKKKKVALFSSIQTKIMFTAGFPILVSISLILMIVMIPMRSELTNVNKEFLYMTTMSYGQRLETAVNLTKNHTDIRKAPYRLANFLKNARLNNCESSYCYLVRDDGIMLYHPDQEKIGMPVEISKIQSIITQMQQGVYAEPDYVSYPFHGKNKIAVYYASSKGFLFVIAVEEEDFLSTLHRMTYVSIGAGVIILIVMLILAYCIAIRITRPIESVADVVDKIGELDFTEDARTIQLSKRKDETGVIAASVEHMRQKLVEIVQRIQSQSILVYDTSNNLSKSAQETNENAKQIENAVTDIAEGASSQAEETSKASSDVTEMGNMIMNTGVQISGLSETAGHMRKTSEDAFGTLEDLAKINEKTSQSIQIIYEQTNQTNISAEKIKQAAQLIASIADETNLLSLNASIEAARAGEAGRGFAVVATEISKLAAESNDSARSIDQIIQELVADAGKAVETMDEVREIMKQQSEMVERTEKAFKMVQEGIDGSLNNAEHIQKHAERLSDARINIVNTVQSLSAIAEENAASSSVTSDAMTHIRKLLTSVADDSKKLNDVAKTLDESIHEIKI